MEVQHFCGQNNKLALEKVRASMGPDALIVSNEKTKDGIKISATLDDGRSLDTVSYTHLTLPTKRIV